MAAGTNAVAVFYADRTYRVRAWDDLKGLRDGERVLLISVQHAQSADPTKKPNTVAHTGHDMTVFAETGEGLMVRDMDMPPHSSEFLRQRTYEAAAPFSQLVTDLTMVIPAPAGMGGMDAAFVSKDFMDEDYDVIQNDALNMSTEIKLDPVPSDGTY